MAKLQNILLYIAVVIVQLISTGQGLLTKASISSGMKPSIFVTYMQAIGFVFLAPFAYFLERKISTPVSLRLFVKIVIMAEFGVTLNILLFLSVYNYASATFVVAMVNIVPSVVFILAAILRLESLAIRKLHGKAKVLGCIVSLSGAMVFSFFKGPALYHLHAKHTTTHSTRTHDKEDWVKGFFMMIAASFTTAFWIIIQANIQKEFPAKLRLTALQCCLSSLGAGVLAAATQRDISLWKLGWDVNLISVLYCGVMVGGISYGAQIWIIGTRGPVFATIFSPLTLVTTAFASALIFKEILHWGSLLGAVLLVAGLYSYLWGKNKEIKIQKYEETTKQPNENITLKCITTTTPECITTATREPAMKNQGGNL